MKNTILVILFSLVFALAGISQEFLYGLSENPVIKQQQKAQAEFKSAETLKYTAPIKLPFYENFKQKGIYPDTARWMDNFVFINTDFPVYPPSWNTATFDAINAGGNIYPDANDVSFIADYLTSRPIRLDSIFLPSKQAITPADSVYLSFFYQPQGKGNDPQPGDSLVLEFGHFTADSVFSFIDSIEVPISLFFPPNAVSDTIFPGDYLLSPCDTSWKTMVYDTLLETDFIKLPCDSIFVPQTAWEWVWSSEGMTLDTFRTKIDTFTFKQVLIPVKDERFFRNDFQFRFYNYASIADDGIQSWQSNCDYWNVDNIYLNTGRNQTDSSYKEITFVERAPSFLREYTAIPFAQFNNDPITFMKGDFRMTFRNSDNIFQTAEYKYVVLDDKNNKIFDYSGGFWSMEVFNNFGFVTWDLWNSPPVMENFPPSSNRDSTYFEITHYLVGNTIPPPFPGGDSLLLTDTLKYKQVFSDYYAYDDGTPEFGYGLSPAGSQLAYQFTLSTLDTLSAVQIFFNKTFSGANEQFFNLAIWKDSIGKPGELIWMEALDKPVFEDNLYGFHTYFFDNCIDWDTTYFKQMLGVTYNPDSAPEILPLIGKFYIGWIQTTDHNLNVGFDASNNTSSHIFYNTTGNWEKSSYKGSLLIRPVFGKTVAKSPASKSTKVDFFRVFPNPAKDGVIELKFLKWVSGKIEPQIAFPNDEILLQTTVEVFNLLGQKVYASPYQPKIVLSQLNNGVYLIRLTNNSTGQAMTEKLLISK